MRIAAWALAAAAVLWAASLPVAAYAASQSSGRSPSGFFALGIYTMGSFICHQRPERSFHLWSVQLPVCARCVGIYLGASIAATAAVVGAELGRPNVDPRPNVEGRASSAPTSESTVAQRIMIVLVAALPAIATLVYEWLSGVAPSNTVRAATGVILGMVTAWLVVRETLR